MYEFISIAFRNGERTARSTSLSAAGEGSRDEFPEYILTRPLSVVHIPTSPMLLTHTSGGGGEERRRH